LLLSGAALFTSLAARAEMLCYRSGAKSAGGSTLQLFKGSCPSGFRALSAEVLGGDRVFTQGISGGPGIKGANGPQGKAGPKGDTGATGDVGAKGLVGPQGMQGLRGEAGPKGAAGDRGAPGLSASELFFFSGGTGATQLGSRGNQQIYPFNQSGGPTGGNSDVSDLMIPVGSSCSAIAFIIAIDSPPGVGNSWKFFLLRGGYASTPAQSDLCSMTGEARSCSFASQLATPLSAETSIVLLADKLGTFPPNTKARWSIRCTAP
jgi:hypothetical protein